MADDFLERLSKRPYTNILHDLNSYNYTIVLRTFNIETLKTTALQNKGIPPEWDSYDSASTITLAATGGTYNFPNRYGDPSQLSDVFVESLSLNKIPVGMRGFDKSTTGTSVELVLKEPNGINFLESMLEAYNVVNHNGIGRELGARGQCLYLLSIYFNGDPSSDPGVLAELKKQTLHIPIIFTTTSMNLTASGATYNLTAAPSNLLANTMAAQHSLQDKITNITGIQIKDYLTDLVKQMNDIEYAVSGDPTSTDKTGMYEYEIKPLGLIAEKYWESLLNSSVTADHDLTKSPMTSIDELSKDLNTPNATPVAPSPPITTTASNLPQIPQNLYLVPSLESQFLAAMTAHGITDPLERAQFYTHVQAESGFTNLLNTGPENANSNYKARGLIQLVGAGNYEKCGSALKLDLLKYPNLVLRPDVAVESAMWYWIDQVRTRMLTVPSSMFSGPRNFSNTYLIFLTIAGANAAGAAQWNPIREERFKKNIAKVSLGSYPTPDKWATWPVQPPTKSLGTSYPVQPEDSDSRYLQPYTTTGGGTSSTNDASVRRQRKQEELTRLKKPPDPTLNTIAISGMKVENIIFKLVLNSAEMATILKDAETTGMPPSVPFVKVYSTIEFKDKNPSAQYNALKKKIVFYMVGYDYMSPTTNGHISAQEENIANQYKNSTIRAYNYLFTGKNADILQLDASVNDAFSLAYNAYTGHKLQLVNANSVVLPPDAPSTTVDTTETAKKQTAASGTMMQSATTLTSPTTYAAGMTNDTDYTEGRIRNLYPEVFRAANKFISLDMDIVGDPELIPKTNLVLSPTEFEERYKVSIDNDSNKNLSERLANLDNFHSTHFYLTISNPDSKKRNNSLFSGFYLFQEVSAHFMASGRFTMSIHGSYQVRLLVTSKEAKDVAKKTDEARVQTQTGQGPDGVTTVTGPGGL